MKAVATDGVAYSVCVSAGHVREPVREPCKQTEPIEVPFGAASDWQGTMY